MKEFFPILQNCSLFEGIAPADLPTLLPCLGGRVYGYKKGQIILQEGQSATWIGIVLLGSIYIC